MTHTMKCSIRCLSLIISFQSGQQLCHLLNRALSPELLLLLSNKRRDTLSAAIVPLIPPDLDYVCTFFQIMTQRGAFSISERM